MAEITIEGLRGLRADFDKAVKKAHVGADKGLQAVGLEIVNEAKRNLTQNKTNTTGRLRASGKVQKDKDGIDAGFFSKEGETGYAAAVEYGRGPTRKGGDEVLTLRESLEAWVKKKFSMSGGKSALKSAAVFSGMKTDAYIKSLAFLIARKIHRQGTKPQPFFAPAVQKYEDKAAEAVQNAVNNALP